MIRLILAIKLCRKYGCQIGLVRWSGNSDRFILVRSGVPEFRTKLYWSGPVARNSGPDQPGPDFRSGNPDHRTGPAKIWSGPEFFLILKLKKNENPCDLDFTLKSLSIFFNFNFFEKWKWNINLQKKETRLQLKLQCYKRKKCKIVAR